MTSSPEQFTAAQGENSAEVGADQAQRYVDAWSEVGDDLPDLGSVESETTNSEAQEAERESLIGRARAAGAAALESAGVVALGQLGRITDRMQARDDRRGRARMTREAAVAQRLEQGALITDDKEILGQSLHLRRSIRGTSLSVMGGLHKARVGIRNGASTPRKKYLEVFRNRNDLKIQKLEEKIATNPDAPEFKRDREWLAMHKARRSHWQNKLEKQSVKKSGRVDRFNAKSGVREDKYQRQIDSYIHKKVEALRKKEFRGQQKSEGIGKFDYRAQAEYFRRLPEEEKRRITAEAIEAIRAKNIKKGKLGKDYAADLHDVTRSIDNYERAVR